MCRTEIYMNLPRVEFGYTKSTRAKKNMREEKPTRCKKNKSNEHRLLLWTVKIHAFWSLPGGTWPTMPWLWMHLRWEMVHLVGVCPARGIFSISSRKNWTLRIQNDIVGILSQYFLFVSFEKAESFKFILYNLYSQGCKYLCIYCDDTNFFFLFRSISVYIRILFYVLSFFIHIMCIYSFSSS